MDYPPPRPPPGMIPPGYGMPPYGMVPPPRGMPPMMPPRPQYAAQSDARLRMPGMHSDLHPPMSGGGPPVTVFVGNITEKAQDAMIRHLLNTCGPVTSWKRVQGATGKLQAFGFCEYGNPDAALRAIRILHDWEIADKKLVVKVDAKTKDVLEDYKKKKRKAFLGEEKEAKADKDNVKDSEYVDPSMKKEDEITKDRIKGIIKEHSKDMNSYVSSSGEKRSRRPETSDGEARLTGPKESLDDVELEDGKRDIINREIGKFRETMKIREAEKEAEKKKREKDQDDRKPKDRSSRDRSDRDRERGGDRNDRNDRSERDRDSQRRTEKRRSRSPRSTSPDRRNNRSNSRRVSRSRSRSRERRSRSRRDSPVRERRDPKDVRRERELEEEDKDRKRAERKASEKERSYQERLRKWETREGKMQKQYDNDKMKEVRRKDDEEREAKKLREFLEDYDDDRDDEKYYKGSKLERRLGEREREAAKDAEDRAREKEEIEELRVQILNEGHADPNAELERRMAELEGRKIVELVDLEAETGNDGIVGVSPPHHSDDDHTVPEVIPMDEDSSSPQANIQMEDPDDKISDDQSHVQQSKPSFIHIQPKKKIDVKDVFNQDDDDVAAVKKKKLPPLPSALTASANANESKKKSNDEDKRKHIKSLIEKIPTDKAALFEYNIDWDLVDNQLMEKRIRPWVNKKIAEYIGEPEPTLTDFICSKVLAGSSPKSVLDDVQMVLDEEAEVFIVKLWRLLIYEIENKKLKAATQQPASANA